MQNKKIAIYSGRFQMSHTGHVKAYTNLFNQFDDAFIAMSDIYDDSNSDSPFTFDQRVDLLCASGIPYSKIIQVKNPYVAKEIVSKYDDSTIITFIVGEKDRDRFNFNQKLNGKPKYLQSYDENKDNLKSQKDHAYVKFMPTIYFNIPLTLLF